jgi:hypothetical protein
MNVTVSKDALRRRWGLHPEATEQEIRAAIHTRGPSPAPTRIDVIKLERELRAAGLVGPKRSKEQIAAAAAAAQAQQEAADMARLFPAWRSGRGRAVSASRTSVTPAV